MDTILNRWLKGYRLHVAILGALLTTGGIGWDLHAASEKVPARVSAVERRVSDSEKEILRIGVRDSAAIGALFVQVQSEVQRAKETDDQHAERMNTAIRQINRMFCMIQHPNSGIAQGLCARSEDRATGVETEAK